MIVILNGPLGIGKSTLAETLAERIDRCVMLDGDALVAANPPSDNPVEHLHSTIGLLVEHHRRFGYDHFVINHIWRSPQELFDLRRRFEPETECRCFLLTLSLEENFQRIELRARSRAIDELEQDLRTVVQEREALMAWTIGELGEILEAGGDPPKLAESLMHRLGIG